MEVQEEGTLGPNKVPIYTFFSHACTYGSPFSQARSARSPISTRQSAPRALAQQIVPKGRTPKQLSVIYTIHRHTYSLSIPTPKSAPTWSWTSTNSPTLTKTAIPGIIYSGRPITLFLLRGLADFVCPLHKLKLLHSFSPGGNDQCVFSSTIFICSSSFPLKFHFHLSRFIFSFNSFSISTFRATNRQQTNCNLQESGGSSFDKMTINNLISLRLGKRSGCGTNVLVIECMGSFRAIVIFICQKMLSIIGHPT